MSRSWGELLGEDGAAPEPEEQGGRFFSRLRDSLGKSRRALTGEIASVAFDPGNDLDWERLEEALISGAGGGLRGPGARGRPRRSRLRRARRGDGAWPRRRDR